MEGVTGSRKQEIRKLSELIDNKSNYYIVAVPEEKYFEVRTQLIGEGLEEFRDFTYWRIFKKKICYLHGNCHMAVVRDMLHSAENFNKEYGIYPLKMIQTINGCISPELLKHIDIFISQDIREENEFGEELSLSHVSKQLQKQCRVIIIPNLFGLGKAFFPQFEYAEIHPIGKNKNGLFPHTNRFLVNEIENGTDIDTLMKSITEEDPFDYDEIINNFNTAISSFKKRECGWDIKIIDYIEDNYRNEQMFYDPGHPTNFVMKEIVQRLIKFMGIEDAIDDNDIQPMDSLEEFVYPCVKRTLKMTWNQKYIRKSSKGARLGKMNLREYLSEYIWWAR